MKYKLYEKKNPEDRPLDFIRQIIKADLQSGKHKKIVTRFPPEPNGFLHIGHAKSICLNFGIAEEYDGECNLRLDDTNPTNEDLAYVESIRQDVEWLGFKWHGKENFTSDYFQHFYDAAVELIKKGKAYVCQLSFDETREYRGTLTKAGKESPFRNRSIEENLKLFKGMKTGKFQAGTHVLRAKIDMASANLNMRDPVIYRILNIDHHRTRGTWKIYPMYDFSHCLSDVMEEVTHSLCTLEFQNHRPLYDWVLNALGTPCYPRQIEFARLNLSHTIMSKRKLLRIVETEYVDGWDDPRMPTISGLRRRGYSPDSIRNFCKTVGIGKSDSRINIGVLENEIRNDLNIKAERRMCILDPIKLIIDNYPVDQHEEVVGKNHPQDPQMGKRPLAFAREIYIERSDFLQDPPKKFYRLGPGREVRLRYGYLIRYLSHEQDEESGEITAIHCTYDPATRGGSAPDKRKIKGTIHWVCAKTALQVSVRLYDRLFTVENPEADKDIDFLDYLNPHAKIVLPHAMAEASIVDIAPGETVQFERHGYFCADPVESRIGSPVFNRTVALRDSWESKR